MFETWLQKYTGLENCLCEHFEVSEVVEIKGMPYPQCNINEYELINYVPGSNVYEFNGYEVIGCEFMVGENRGVALIVAGIVIFDAVNIAHTVWAINVENEFYTFSIIELLENLGIR
jgi:hypothetical protein